MIIIILASKFTMIQYYNIKYILKSIKKDSCGMGCSRIHTTSHRQWYFSQGGFINCLLFGNGSQYAYSVEFRINIFCITIMQCCWLISRIITKTKLQNTMQRGLWSGNPIQTKRKVNKNYRKLYKNMTGFEVISCRRITVDSKDGPDWLTYYWSLPETGL